MIPSKDFQTNTGNLEHIQQAWKQLSELTDEVERVKMRCESIKPKETSKTAININVVEHATSPKAIPT